MPEFFFKEKDPTLLSGTPYEIGYQHGEIYKEKVHMSLETYERMFWEYSRLSWKEACSRANLHLDAIEEYNKSYLQEIEGIAKGSGTDFTDILALNTRSELTLVSSIDGCTAFYVKSDDTADAWIGQNWDWKGTQAKSIINISIQQENVPTINMITEAGIIGKIGCNSSGLGVCLNALKTDAWKPKVPIHLGLRAILESHTLEEAISRVKHNQMASAAHFLIGSNDGRSISVEVSPKYTDINEMKQGYQTHTNHICSKGLREIVMEEALEDSFVRLDAINEIISNMKEKSIAATDLFHMLSDHKNYPNSICRHECHEQPDELRMETVFSIVMNLNKLKLYWIHGKPCEEKNVMFQNL